MYTQQYSRNGVYSLLGGSKGILVKKIKKKIQNKTKLVHSLTFSGNFALFNWKNNQLLTERDVQDNIHDVSILHNQQLFALAQSHYVYIYDSKGTKTSKLLI